MIASEYIDKGFQVGVLDPHLDPGWDADFLTDKQEDIIYYADSTTKNLLIVDEAGEMIGRYGRTMNRLATMGRHRGHKCMFLAQRAMQLDPTTRSQCTHVIAFEQCKKDAILLSDDFNCEEFLEAPRLQQGEAIIRRKGFPVSRMKLNFPPRNP